MFEKTHGWKVRAAFLGFILFLCNLPKVPAGAEDLPIIAVTIKDHRFTPSEIHAPQGKPVVLRITNEDTTPEEFDSMALKVEKVIVGGTYGTVRLRPLGPGRYPFMGEFHPDTAQGVVIAE